MPDSDEVVSYVRSELGIQLEPWQEKVLRGYMENPEAQYTLPTRGRQGPYVRVHEVLIVANNDQLQASCPVCGVFLTSAMGLSPKKGIPVTNMEIFMQVAERHHETVKKKVAHGQASR